jgi:hypothetical protein
MRKILIHTVYCISEKDTFSGSKKREKRYSFPSRIDTGIKGKFMAIGKNGRHSSSLFPYSVMDKLLAEW